MLFSPRIFRTALMTLGATGAGWGGCTVHLVADGKVDAVLEALMQKYYNGAIKEFPAAAARFAQRPQDALLALRPSAGARVLF